MSNLIADCKLYISTRMRIDKVGNIMNYIELITPDEKTPSVKLSQEGTSKNYSSKMKRSSQKSEKVSEQKH